MGGDFTYQDAGMWYRNLDKLIEYSNIKAAQDGLNVKLYYSTPNCYLKAVQKSNPVLPTKQDDFFPYASDSHAYWTGYFTSRPTTKWFEREANSYLQMVKQLQSLAGLAEHNQYVVNELKSALGIMQHHDAITGTEKQLVAYDYERILNTAIDDALIVARQAFNKYMQGDAASPPIFSFERCRLNESSCYTSETSDQFVVSVYNHLAWPLSEVIRIPVIEGNYEVFAPNGDQIETQIVDIPTAVTNIPTRVSRATHEIFFVAKLHPVSFKTFYVRKSDRVKRSAYYDKNTYPDIGAFRKAKEFVDVADDKDKYDADAMVPTHYVATGPEYDKINEKYDHVHLINDKGAIVDKPRERLVDILRKPDGKDRLYKDKPAVFEKVTVKDSKSSDNKQVEIISFDLGNAENDLEKREPKRRDDDYWKEKAVEYESDQDYHKRMKLQEQADQKSRFEESSYWKSVAVEKPRKTQYEDSSYWVTPEIRAMRYKIDDAEPQWKGKEHEIKKTVFKPVIPDENNKITKKEISVFDEDTDKDVDQLVKIIKENRRKSLRETRRRPKMVTPKDEEMMSDDPLVVQRFDEFFGYGDQKLRLNHEGQPTHVIAKDGTEIPFTANFLYYPGATGDNSVPSNRSSGAYIFRPNANAPIPIEMTHTAGPSGPIVKEIRMSSDEHIFNTIRVYNGFDFFETDWVVGPIDVSENVGKEYIVEYKTNIKNNGEFYTDSNGRQSLKRKLNKRPQYNLTLEEPIAGNYYPITNKININDDKNKMSVLTDRSQGGSSLSEGEIELMLHRRLLSDDAFGVGEALNEKANGEGLVVRGRHRLMFSSAESKTDCINERKQVLQFHLQPLVLVADAAKLSKGDWLALHSKAFSWINALPEGVHLLTVEPWNDNNLLVRLENYLEIGDKDVTTIDVDLKAIFKTVTVKSYKETMLGGNVWTDEYAKWSWNKKNRFSVNFNDDYSAPGVTEKSNDDVEELRDDGFVVKLRAKQIRTFVVEYVAK